MRNIYDTDFYYLRYMLPVSFTLFIVDDPGDGTLKARNLRKRKARWNELVLYHDSPEPLPKALS